MAMTGGGQRSSFQNHRSQTGIASSTGMSNDSGLRVTLPLLSSQANRYGA